MKRYQVRFATAARDDLIQIFDDVLQAAGHTVAEAFVARLTDACLKLDAFPARGTVRDEIRPGLRLIGYRRQASIAFVVREDEVVVLRVLRRGQEVHTVLRAAEEDELRARQDDIREGLASGPAEDLDMAEIKGAARQRRERKGGLPHGD